MTLTTEIALVGGVRYQVNGAVDEVEQVILAAARGSIMELAWLIDAKTGERIGVNPPHVVSLRRIGS